MTQKKKTFKRQRVMINDNFLTKNMQTDVERNKGEENLGVSLHLFSPIDIHFKYIIPCSSALEH